MYSSRSFATSFSDGSDVAGADAGLAGFVVLRFCALTSLTAEISNSEAKTQMQILKLAIYNTALLLKRCPGCESVVNVFTSLLARRKDRKLRRESNTKQVARLIC